MTYAGDRIIFDADSHLMELPDFLSAHASADTLDILPNLKKSLTGQFNSDTPFSIPTHTSNPGTPSGNLAPNLPGGDVSTFKITNPGGSGNTHLFVHEIRINGATVDFGRNYI